jgi:hypothetical protein
MIDQFSPVTRRILAVGIAILALFGLVNLVVAPVYGVTGRSLAALADVRFRLARLEAIKARPIPARSVPVPVSLYVAAPDRESATDRLIAAINDAAGRYGVEVDSATPLEPDPSRPKAVGVSLQARGGQDQMLAWINELERGEPAVHFATWSLSPNGEAPSAATAPGMVVDPEGIGATASSTSNPGGGLQLGFTATAATVWERPS